MDSDIDDTHLCIKCNQTIVGLENYIQHRKQNCNRSTTTTTSNNPTKNIATQANPTPQQSTNVETPPINYEPFHFNEPEPEPPTSTSHGGKTSKNLADNYDLPYELGADVFFSSLQLQSVQSSVGHHVPASTGGKTCASSQAAQLQRQKSLQTDHNTHEVDESWINNHHAASSSQHNFLKDINDMGEAKKSYDTIFKPISFEHESPEPTDDEDDDEVDVDMDDDDEDYEPLHEAHATGGKWKMPLMRHSPPVVPVSHTGGKWKPEHRPNLRVAHSQISRLSPNWDDHMDEVEATEGQHPPSDHTKGKWIPGTKLQRLEYKETVELAKCNVKQDYWCNICCRKLKSKAIYENHLKTSYHLKRSEPETLLEKAIFKEMSREDISRNLALEASNTKSGNTATTGRGKKRRRRSTYLRCSLCKHVMARYLIGKHLISHYHYRRMQINPGLSLHMILEHIHSIVLQSPFQCRPCHFYANTEETFLLHWNSASHKDASEGAGRFWCSYCQFECEDNNQMRRHLLGPEHKEVLLAINRSVPICISKRLNLNCTKCSAEFRFNFELRKHMGHQHPGITFSGSASDIYQSKFRCLTCPEVLTSQIALQRHEKFKHSISKYFCSICSLEFNSPCKARRHRKTVEHKLKAVAAEGEQKIGKKENKSSTVAEKRNLLSQTLTKRTITHEKLVGSQSKVNEEHTTHESAEIISENVETATKEKQMRNKITAENPPELHERIIKLEIVRDDLPSTSQAAKRRCLIQKSKELPKEPREKKHSHSKCMICGVEFVTAQELGQHSRKCLPRLVKKDQEAENESQDSHNIEHSEKSEVHKIKNQMRQCDLCDFRTPFESDIIYHRLFHANASMGSQQLIKCPLCEKTFRKHSLRCHLRQHTNEKIFKCAICEAKYTRPQNLKDHVDRVHSTQIKEVPATKDKNQMKTFPCDSCEKIFRSKKSLQNHCLTHHVTMPDRRFVCPHENCDYGTVKSGQLKVHLASHSNESFKCPEKNCTYVGKSELHMKRHQKNHLAEINIKFFNCDKCEFKTKIKGHLRRHERCHTGEKPFQCQHCDFRSNALENLRKHVLKTGKHPGKFVYECKKCQTETKNDNEQHFKTNSFVEYQKHLSKVHNIVDKPKLRE